MKAEEPVPPQVHIAHMDPKARCSANASTSSGLEGFAVAMKFSSTPLANYRVPVSSTVLR
jgi:hypothetical protein